MKFVVVAAVLCLTSGNGYAGGPWDKPSGIASWDEYTDVERDVFLKRSIKDTAFRPGRQYKYYYDGQVISGVTMSGKQHSGTRMQSVVTFQMESQNTFLMKLEHIRMAQLNKDILDTQLMIPFRYFDPVPLTGKFQKQMEMPVKFQYTDGMVRNIYFEATDSTETRNMKLGVLNMLQINMKEQRSTETDHQRLLNMIRPLNGYSKFFRAMEDTIEGDCEATYSISEQPEVYNHVVDEDSPTTDRDVSQRPRLNITKSINFQRCNRRPQVFYNYRAWTPCCENENTALRSSSVFKYNVMGSRTTFLIESVSSDSQHIVGYTEERESRPKVYIRQSLRLFRTEPVTKPFLQQNPSNVVPNLMYSQEWDREYETSYKSSQGPDGSMTTDEQLLRTATNLMKKLAISITGRDGNPVDTATTMYYCNLVSTLRKMKRDGLAKVVDMVYRRSSHLVLSPTHMAALRNIVLPAVASTGTGAAVDYLKAAVSEISSDSVDIATTLRQLTNSYVVSSEMVQNVKMICESPPVASNPEIKKTCYLTLGIMIHALCNTDQDLLASDTKSTTTEHCSISRKKEYIQIFLTKMQQSEKWEDKILYLKSLGNAGIDVSVMELERIVLNIEKVYPEHIRHEAIVALRKLSHRMPRKVQKILMSVYMNPSETSGLRQLAAQHILASLPDRSLLEVMAKQINKEPYRQVSMYTYQLMSEIANSTNRCYGRLSSDIRLALQRTKPLKPGLYDSQMMRWTLNSVLEPTDVDFSLSKLMTHNSLIPRLLAASVSTNSFGTKSQDMLYMNAFTEGLETLMSKPVNGGKEPQFSLNDLFTRKERHGHNRETLRNIFDKLNMRYRSITKTMRAHIDWGMFENTLGYYAINEDLIRQLVQSGFVARMERSLRAGNRYHMAWHHATMLQDSQAKMPTTVGLPLIIKLKWPLVVKLEGSVKVKISPSWKGLDIAARLNPSFSTKHEKTVEVWSPITQTGVRTVTTARVHVPIAGKVDIDVSDMEANLKMETPSKTRELMHLETQAITFTKDTSRYDILPMTTERTVYPDDTSRLQWNSKSYHAMGMNFEVNTAYATKLSERNRLLCPIAPLAGPNRISLKAMKPQDNTREITMKILFTGSYKEEQPIRTSLLHDRLSESETESLSSEELEPSRFIRSQHRYGSVVVEVNTIGGDQPKKYQALLKTSGNLHGRFGRFTGKLSRISPQPYQMCIESEIFYPEPPFTRESASGKKILIESKLKWGQSCNTNNYIQVSMASERTHEQEQMEKSEMESFYECKTNEDISPMQCYDYLKSAGLMNKYSFNVKYNHVPSCVRNMTSHAFRMLQWNYFPNVDFVNVDVYNPANQIKAWLHVSPRDRRRFNLTVKAPGENVTFRNVISPMRLPRMSVRQPLWENVLGEVAADSSHRTYQYTPTCQIHSDHVDRVETFDGRRYHAPLTTCWSVVAKDCSKEQIFAVLMKKVSRTTDLKTAKIITHDDELKLRKSGPLFVVKQNGRRYVINPESSKHHKDSKEEQQRCTKMGPYIECNIEEVGLTVYYDGFSAHIKVSPSYVGKLCGLCGHMNFEPADDFQTPELKATSDVRYFQYRYIYKDEKCHENSLPTPSEICPTIDCKHKSTYEPLSSQETSVEPPFQHYNMHRNNPEPRMLNRIFHHMGKTCFSKEPLATCPEYAYPQEAVQREVEYSCLDEGDTRTHSFVIRARSLPIQEARELPTEFVRMEFVPKLCMHHRLEQKL